MLEVIEMHSAVLTFESSLTDITEANASFDSGVLRIAYPGRNRNNTSISKDAFQKCLPTIRNCPVVCNYMRDTDSLGGHDAEVVRGKDGTISLCNLTTPVGVVPESARQWWETVTEEDGTEREYLHTEVLLWKRQEAYKKIKQDGVVKHSMEICVKDGEMKDGYLEIRDFEFTAFVLIGTEPCFESSALELFSLKDFKEKMEEMMFELKGFYDQTEGGEEMNKETESVVQTDEAEIKDEPCVEAVEGERVVSDTCGGSEDGTCAESAGNDGPSRDESTGDAEEQNGGVSGFALTRAVMEALERALEAGEKLCREWGTYPRYSFEDFDPDAGEVYAWDREDFSLFGFKYEMNGDNAVIDFGSKTKKKYVIADFDEGDRTASPFLEVFNAMKAWGEENASFKQRFEEASEKINELEAFRLETEKAHLRHELTNVLNRFSALKGIDAFDALCEAVEDGSVNMSTEDLEEKCYAITGRFSVRMQPDSKSPKIAVGRSTPGAHDDIPYGGVVEDYMNKKTGGK